MEQSVGPSVIPMDYVVRPDSDQLASERFKLKKFLLLSDVRKMALVCFNRIYFNFQFGGRSFWLAGCQVSKPCNVKSKKKLAILEDFIPLSRLFGYILVMIRWIMKKNKPLRR